MLLHIEAQFSAVKLEKKMSIRKIGGMNFSSFHNLTPSDSTVASNFEILSRDDVPNSIYAVTLSPDNPVAIGPFSKADMAENAALAHLTEPARHHTVNCMNLEITGYTEGPSLAIIRMHMARSYMAIPPNWTGSRTEWYTLTGKISKHYAAEHDLELDLAGQIIISESDRAAVFYEWNRIQTQPDHD